MAEHLFSYRWNLKDTIFTKDKGKVFSCFACGGGSTMGYKLAGFDVLGCNEIDPKMIEVYKENHHPKYAFCEGIQTFKNRDDLPEELYNLDILDGSPPCSSFSQAGNREKDWGKEKKFREGQVNQVLDTLFFDFIDLTKKLQPKLVIAENVKGLLLGNAYEYVKKIMKEFDEAGYLVSYYLLNSKDMGVPQKRERVFFVCLRKDLVKSKFIRKSLFGKDNLRLNLEFNEKEIPFKEISDENDIQSNLTPRYMKYYNESFSNSRRSVGKFKSQVRLDYYTPAYTTVSSHVNFHPCIPRKINKKEVTLIQSFPLDFNFLNEYYGCVCGMSVPPVMMAQVAKRVYDQILSKL